MIVSIAAEGGRNIEAAIRPSKLLIGYAVFAGLNTAHRCMSQTATRPGRFASSSPIRRDTPGGDIGYLAARDRSEDTREPRPTSHRRQRPGWNGVIGIAIAMLAAPHGYPDAIEARRTVILAIADEAQCRQAVGFASLSNAFERVMGWPKYSLGRLQPTVVEVDIPYIV